VIFSSSVSSLCTQVSVGSVDDVGGWDRRSAFGVKVSDHELVFFTDIGLRGSILRPETGADYEQENEFFHGARRPLLGSDFLVTRQFMFRAAGSRLASMGGQNDDCSQQGGQQLFFGRELVCSFVGEQPGYGNPDESVKRTPDQVDRGNLVSEELNGKRGNGRGDYGPSCKDVQSRGEWEVSYERQQAQGGYSGIEVQARGEGDCGHQGEQFVRRDLQQVEHWPLEANDSASGEMERVLDRSSQSCGGFRGSRPVWRMRKYPAH
jgi:hypothetical protein